MSELLFMFIGATAVYFGIEHLFRCKWDDRLEADIKFSSGTAYPGDEVRLYEVITNQKRLPIPLLNVKIRLDRRLHFEGAEANASISDFSYKNDVFSIYSHQRITRSIPILCRRRGFFYIRQMEMVSAGAFMGDILHKSVAVDSSLVVYPAPCDVRGILIPYQKVMGQILARQRMYEDPFEFTGIREYQPFDTMNSVNWKATARTAQLKVNVRGHTAFREAMVLLNLENEGMQVNDRLQEASISLAASLTEMLVCAGVNVGLMTNGKDFEAGTEGLFFGGSGQSHVDSVKVALARIDLNAAMRPFAELMRQNRERILGGGIWVLISAARRPEMVRLFDEAAAGGGGIWILPYVTGSAWEPAQPSCMETVPWEVKPYD